MRKNSLFKTAVAMPVIGLMILNLSACGDEEDTPTPDEGNITEDITQSEEPNRN